MEIPWGWFCMGWARPRHMPAALGRGWDGAGLGQHERGLGKVPGWMLDKDKAGSHCFPFCFLVTRLEGLSCFMEKGKAGKS